MTRSRSSAAARADDWQASVQASVAAYLDAVTSGQQPGLTPESDLDIWVHGGPGR
jgi:hypothetical protein